MLSALSAASHPRPGVVSMIVALAGGVGGAKLAHGLSMCLPPRELAVLVNTADDFDIYGLRVCPDLDTVMYTLAGVANPETGWGVKGDTFAALDMLRTMDRIRGSALGTATWRRTCCAPTCSGTADRSRRS